MKAHLLKGKFFKQIQQQVPSVFSVLEFWGYGLAEFIRIGFPCVSCLSRIFPDGVSIRSWSLFILLYNYITSIQIAHAIFDLGKKSTRPETKNVDSPFDVVYLVPDSIRKKIKITSVKIFHIPFQDFLKKLQFVVCNLAKNIAGVLQTPSITIFW